MGKVNKHKFYRPGSLEVPGTLITLKTQPYTNGVVFNMDDPISSFRASIASLNNIVHQYEYLASIDGMKQVFEQTYGALYTPQQIGALKLLLNYLAESPIEIILKEQVVDRSILTDLEVAQNEQH